MTYSLHTLHAKPASVPKPASAASRFSSELFLLFAFVLLVVWVVALLTYSVHDPAWSTSGNGDALRNRAGRLGAWIADMSYFLLGYSVWWCVALSGRAWLSALANKLRSEDLPDTATDPGTWRVRWRPRLLFWVGFACLLSEIGRAHV